MSIFTICQKLHPFATLSFRWKASDTNLKRRSLLPRGFERTHKKGIGRPQGYIIGLYYMPRREGTHRWLRSGGSHGPLEPQDQDKRGGRATSQCSVLPWKAAWGCSLGPPWPTCGIQEISMSLSTDGWSPPTNFTTVQMIRPQLCETHDSGRPDRPHWPSLVSQPSSRATSVRKPHPLTVESQWVLPIPRTIFGEWGTWEMQQEQMFTEGEWVIQRRLIKTALIGNST